MPKNVRKVHPTIVTAAALFALSAAAVLFALFALFVFVFVSGAAATVGAAVTVGGIAAPIAFCLFALALKRAGALRNDRQSSETSTGRRDAASGGRRSRAFSSVGRLLPAEVRDECCEEWTAWMADLRTDGTPRVRRWLELLSIVLIAVPRLAIGLRVMKARRAVDR